MLLLGNSGAGKRSLIRTMYKQCGKTQSKLIDVEDLGSSYPALDSAFVSVRDYSEGETADELTRINIWMLQEHKKSGLLRKVLKPADLQYTVAVILLDLSEPWDLMNSLFKWIEVVRELVFSVLPTLPRQQQEELKDKIKNHVLTYEEPDINEEGKLVKKVTETPDQGDISDEEETNELKKQLPL